MNPTREKNLLFAGQDLTLRANFASIAGFERVLGVSVFAGVQKIAAAECTLQHVHGIMSEIFRANKVKMTPDQIGDGIIDYGLSPLLIWLGEFFIMGVRPNDDPPKDDAEGEAQPAT